MRLSIRLIWLCLFTVLFLEVQASPSPALPEGLSASDWAEIKGQIDAARYAARESTGGYQALNPEQGWTIEYGRDGRTRIRASDPGSEPYRIDLKLEAIGYGDDRIALGTPEALANTDNAHVEYRWNEGLSESWRNGPAGVEQSFELRGRPSGAARGQDLVLAMKLESDLKATLDTGALSLTRSEPNIRIAYNKLRVWDASGHTLPARMDLNGTRLALVVDDREAHYPLTIDPTFSQQAYLKASNTDSFDQFGFSVAISGDSLVVGAPFEARNATGVDGDGSDNSVADSGAAYVFVRSGTTWSQQAYLKASNTDEIDYFGTSVAISGDSVVVGALGEDSNATGVGGNQSSNSVENSGAAYVFVRSGTTWSQQAYLKASNTDDNDEFGSSVAISGDSVVVGARGEGSNATGVNGDQFNNDATNSGAAYVFVRSGTTWSHQAYLKASNTGAGDVFGWSVAISGDSIVVGAVIEDSNATGVNGDGSNNLAGFSGAAYVFVRSGTTWSQQAYLKASNTDAFDEFGTSVAISGDTVAVGARFEDSNAAIVDGDGSDNSAFQSGAAYVFVRSGTAWSQQAYLKASNTDDNDEFGSSVAISGDSVAVGAMGEDSSAFVSGAAYGFVRSGAAWSQQAYLKASKIPMGAIISASRSRSRATACWSGRLARLATPRAWMATGPTTRLSIPARPMCSGPRSRSAARYRAWPEAVSCCKTTAATILRSTPTGCSRFPRLWPTAQSTTSRCKPSPPTRARPARSRTVRAL